MILFKFNIFLKFTNVANDFDTRLIYDRWIVNDQAPLFLFLVRFIQDLSETLRSYLVAGF